MEQTRTRVQAQYVEIAAAGTGTGACPRHQASDFAPRQRVWPMATSGALGDDPRTFVMVHGYCYSLDQPERKFNPPPEAEHWAIPMNLEDVGDHVEQLRAFRGGGSNWTKTLERVCRCNVMVRGHGAEGAKIDGIFVVDSSVTSPPVVFVSAKPGDKINKALDLVEQRLEEVRRGEFHEMEGRLREVHERRSELMQSNNQQALADMKEELKQIHSDYSWHLRQKWSADVSASASDD